MGDPRVEGGPFSSPLDHSEYPPRCQLEKNARSLLSCFSLAYKLPLTWRGRKRKRPFQLQLRERRPENSLGKRRIHPVVNVGLFQSGTLHIFSLFQTFFEELTKMFLKMPFLLLLIGSVSFRGFAEEASTVLLEEETATGDGDGSGPPTLLPTKLEDTSDTFPPEEQMTTESAVSPSEDTENTTEPEAPESSEDGLETAALVGIIIGIVVAIGVVTGIIITVAKKMSGRT